MSAAMVADQDSPKPLSFRPKQKTSAEAIVVGGGLSGLYAAHEVQISGSTCLVLEKDDSLGSKRQAVDVGVDETLHPRVMSMLHELGLASDVLERREGVHGTCLTGDISSVSGFVAFVKKIPRLTFEQLDANDRRSFTRVRDNLERLSQKVDVNRPSQMLPQFGNMTVKELARSHSATPAVLDLADHWTRSLFGVSAEQVAALTFLIHCKTHGGFRQALEAKDTWVLRGGLREAIAEKLHPGSVVLSQSVERVDQTSGGKVVVTTSEGNVFQGTKVIVALPLSEYGLIEIIPEVSEDKQWLWSTEVPRATSNLPIPAKNLRDLERDQWHSEEDVHFAGSETSYAWRAHVEGALAAGSRAVGEILQSLQPHAEDLSARL